MGLENLPVLPDHFDLVPKEKTKDRLYLLKLAERPDVTEIINACDAVVSELIFRNTMRWIGGKKPTRRLWLQSVTTVRFAGFERLRSEQEMRPLTCRPIACRKRLAGWHQRRARYFFQFTQRRFPNDRGRPGPDTDAGDSCRARRKNPWIQAAALF
jgi:hypothetical protein